MAGKLIPEMFRKLDVPEWMVKLFGPVDGLLLDGTPEEHDGNQKGETDKVRNEQYRRLAEDALRRGDHHSHRIYMRQANGGL